MDEGRKYEQLAFASLQNNNRIEAEAHFLKALKHMEMNGDETGQAYLLGNLGNFYFQDKSWDLAQDYYHKALLKMEKANDLRGVENTLGNLGNLYFYKENLEAAQKNYQKALELTRKANNPQGQ